MFTNYMADIRQGNKEWEDRIYDQWDESKKMPRKMKKRVRKSLLVDYSILQWGKDLMDGKYF